MIATASLELGIDIGDVELVCQLGSPRSIATFLQRVGRSGHAIDGTPKGRLFPLSRDDLIECAALLDSVRRGELDRLTIPAAPLDVLAQQIVAEVAAQDWAGDRAFRPPAARLALPELWTREDFDAVVRILAEGFATRVGRRGALIHRDAIHGVLRGRRGARTTALTSGGRDPRHRRLSGAARAGKPRHRQRQRGLRRREPVGRRVPARQRLLPHPEGRARDRAGRGRQGSAAEPAVLARRGARPDGRAVALRLAPARGSRGAASRRSVGRRTENAGSRPRSASAAPAAEEIAELPRRPRLAALGVLPTQEVVALERFFDESGGMQLVIHSPYGSRLNRAWGLALRKRFCRKFNFEIQAAATEDAIVLSLTAAHSFALDEVSALSQRENRPAAARAGDARCADVRGAMAVGGGIVACAAALPLRQEGAAADPADAGGGPDRSGLPRPDRLLRESGGRPRGPRSSPRQSGGLRLPARSDGHRGARAVAAAGSKRARSTPSAAI